MIDCSKTKNYLTEKNRMTKSVTGGVCKIACINCPLSRYNNGKNMLCGTLEFLQPETAVKIVQQWSNDNSQKTYLSEFLRNYPHAPLDEKGLPKGVCPYYLGLKHIEDCKKGCKRRECWNQSID